MVCDKESNTSHYSLDIAGDILNNLQVQNDLKACRLCLVKELTSISVLQMQQTFLILFL